MKLNEPVDHIADLPDSLDGEPGAEARRQIRYPLRAQVSFTWFDEDGKRRDARGNSRNMNEGGAYIVSRNCPQIGAQIILVFRFLHMPAFANSQRLEMNGQVVRAEAFPDGKGMYGFAVASTWTVLQDTEGSDQEAAATE